MNGPPAAGYYDFHVNRVMHDALSREMRWLLSIAGKLSRFHCATFSCIILSSGFGLADPLILRLIIDRALPNRDTRLLGLAAGLFCLAFIARLGFTYGAIVFGTIAAQKLIFRTRLRVLRRLNQLPARFHDNTTVGDSLYRFDQDVSRIGELGAEVIPSAARMVITGAMVLTTMMVLDYWLTVLICPLLVAFYQSQKRQYIRLRTIAQDVQERAGAVNGFLEEHLNGIRQLKLLNRTNTRTRSLARTLAEMARIQTRQRMSESRFTLISMAIIVAGNTLILGFGGHEVIAGRMTAGTLVAFYGYLLRLFEPLIIATDLQARGQRVAASIRRILEILESQPERQPVAGTMTKPQTAMPPRLEFREISFAYRKNRPVLNKVSFCVHAGDKVAVVGMNGSGKSTIGQIATGLYSPDCGSVLINGHDISRCSRASIHTVVSLVPQDPVIFSGTVRENLLYGNPRASESEIRTVAEFAQLEDVLRKFPHGMNEVLGPKGRKLSGGERKRLALARAMLQKPQILILDEVTAALDEPAAASLLSNLDRFHNGNIVIAISHRPATIAWASRILVLDRGTVLDDGTHEALLGRCAAYQAIYLGSQNR